MPVELSFQCYCSCVRPGDRLKVVGEGPSLGDWDPHRSPVFLHAAQFPLWKVPTPVLLKSSADFLTLEYKYVLLGEDGSIEWEEFAAPDALAAPELPLGDLGFEELPRSLSLSSEESQGVVNRRLEIEGDCVVLCTETFNQLATTFKAMWPIRDDWGPDLAGSSAVIGRGKHRNSLNPLFKLQYQLPRQVFVAHRRGRLVSVLSKLHHRIELAPGLWTHIMAFVGEALPR